MRNRFPATCYRCGEQVGVQQGHFERYKGGWRTQHATCAITWRGTDHTFKPPREPINWPKVSKPWPTI